MEKVMAMLKPKPNPQQQLRDWQRRLRQECRNIERQIRGSQGKYNLGYSLMGMPQIFRGKSVQKAIRDAAKRNDMVSTKELAKEIVISRRTINRLYENKAQLNSISMHLGESVGIRVVEEMVNDAVDSALDSDDIEDEIEEDVDKVLTAIAGKIATQLPQAVRKERVKQPAHGVRAAEEEEAIAEGANDEEELEEKRARLAKVMS